MNMKHDFKFDRRVEVDAKATPAPRRVWLPETLAIIAIVAVVWIMLVARFAMDTAS